MHSKEDSARLLGSPQVKAGHQWRSPRIQPVLYSIPAALGHLQGVDHGTCGLSASAVMVSESSSQGPRSPVVPESQAPLSGG